MNKTTTYALLLTAIGIAAFALVQFGPPAFEAIGGLPPAYHVATAVVVAAAASFFAWPQFKRLAHDRNRAQLRANLNPVVQQTAGSADTVLNVKVPIEPEVRSAYQANLAQCRFPPDAVTGRPHLTSNGTIRITTPITAGQDLPSAVQFAETEDSVIRTAHDMLRNLLSTEFGQKPAPAMVNTFVGAHYEKGTTGLRTVASQGDVLAFQDADHSVLNILHEPVRKRHPYRNKDLVEVDLGPPPGPAKQKEEAVAARKDLRFPVPRPVRFEVVSKGETAEAAESPKRRLRRPDRGVRHRSDLLLQAMTNYAHGWVALARVQAASDHELLDRKLRAAVSVAEIAAQWGSALTGTLETKRLTRDGGCGIIGSWSDEVFTLQGRGSLTALIQRLRLHGVRTLEGFGLHPGDSDAEGRTRRVFLFAYGSPALVKEIPRAVQGALDIGSQEFFQVTAGVPNMKTAKFALFIEASADELDEAFPGITEHPLWEEYIETVHQWNTVKSDDQEAIAQEA